MVVKPFWGCLGLVLGAFGRVLCELFRASRLKKQRWDSSWDSLGFVCSLLAADDGLGSVDMLFYLPSEPLGADF